MAKQLNLRIIEGVISERNLLMNLFATVGYQYREANEVEREISRQGEEIEVSLLVKAEDAESVLDKLVQKGFVGRIKDDEVWDF